MVVGLFSALLILYMAALSTLSHCTMVTIPEETTLQVMDLIRYWKYPAEEHEVRTDDGYYLKLHRIPHGRSITNVTSRGPILLHHGILLDSTSWVSNLPHQSLG